MEDACERLDVVNERDEPVDTARRDRVHEEGLLHRAVHALLLRDEGGLLVQRRSEDKRTYPGQWTSSASGHVPAGESPGEAAKREINEELGVDAPMLDPLGTLRIEDLAVGEREITHVFVGSLPAARVERLRPDPREVSEVKWLSLEAVDASLREHPDRWARSFEQVFGHVREELDRRVGGA